MVTKDDDFVRMVLNAGRPQIVWVRLGNCSNAALIQRMTGVWPEVVTRLREGERLIEVR